MKSLRILSIVCGLFAAGYSTAGEKDAATESRVKVVYESPEKFTDFNTSGIGAADEKDLQYLTGMFTAHIEKLAKKVLAPDERLEITFKDIDLAGQFEPERGPAMQDVRIYRDITYPRMHFFFRVLGPDGHVRAEGERKLTDMDYNMKIRLPTSDMNYRPDMDLLSDWMGSEFKQKKH